MNKFILVHDAANEASPIVINSETIQYVEASEDYTGASTIYTDNADFDVTETREQIFEMLQN